MWEEVKVINAKKLISKKKIEIVKAQKTLEEISTSIEAVHVTITQVTKEHATNLEREENIARESAMKKCTAPLENDRSKLETDLQGVEKERADKIQEFSLNNIKKKILSESPISETTQSLITEIRQEANDTISERFVDCYFALTANQEVDEEDFLYALDQLETVRDNFIYCKDSKLNLVIERVENFIHNSSKSKESNSENEEDSGDVTSSNSSTVKGVGVVFLVLAFVLFPLYAGALTVVLCTNVRRSIYMKQSLDILKIVSDNLLFMQDVLDKKSQIEYKEKQHEVDSEYSVKVKDLQDKIQEKGNEISIVRQNQIADFKFDVTPIEEELKVKLGSLNYKVNDLEQKKQEAINVINNLQKDLENLGVSYDLERNSTISKYLNYEQCGTDLLFPKKFLLTTEEPLKYFDHANASNFFLYKDRDTVDDFIKLACTQLRSLMNPSSFQIEIWDVSTAGVPFVRFMNPDPNGDSLGITIQKATSSLAESLVSLELLLQKRLQVVRVSYDSLDDYNQDMISLKSVTETYHIIFILSPKSLIENESYHRLLLNGAESGIILYTFVSIDDVSESHFNVITNSNYCSNVGNGTVTPSASTAMKDAVLALKEK